jgi:hypothetical protein
MGHMHKNAPRYNAAGRRSSDKKRAAQNRSKIAAVRRTMTSICAALP